ncbi:TPA: ATP-binding protein [Stenotrophomonas maltophilia]|nr:ATP-binding protein [Stenotrophomonas maltophilia]
MISDEDLGQLRYKGEGADLDFKEAQYPFSFASEHQKSELLKDIMAMANAYRSGPGYILIGFKDLAPHPAEIVGISAEDHIDDAALQQLVRSKIEPPLEFQYEERLLEGKHIAVITIPSQVRPFVPKQDFGKLKKHVALVRRGSSTDEASIAEMMKMTLTDSGSSKTARVDLSILTEENQLLPNSLKLTFLRFGELPDYQEEYTTNSAYGFMPPRPLTRFVNRHYYRDGAQYHAERNRLVLVRLSLSNQSDFAMQEVKLELTCLAPSGETVQMLRSDDLADEPEPGHELHSMLGHVDPRDDHRETVSVDDRAREPACKILLGTLRPGETGTADTDIALLPTAPGDYVIRCRILAKEIAIPIAKEHAIRIDGEIKEMELDDLERLLSAKYLDELK